MESVENSKDEFPPASHRAWIPTPSGPTFPPHRRREIYLQEETTQRRVAPVTT
jgi:hypothetical protein